MYDEVGEMQKRVYDESSGDDEVGLLRPAK